VSSTLLRLSILFCAGLVGLAGCKLAGYSQTRATRISAAEKEGLDARTLGATRFAFDDLGGLNTDTLQTNAFPWKVVVTAMAIEFANRKGLTPTAELIPRIFQQYGWIMPSGVDNWPGKQAPTFDKPVGIVSGEIRRSVPKIRLEVANMGCAACHAGMSYDANGLPTGRIWLGSTNSSRFFDGYTRDILTALRHVRNRQDELLTTIPKLFPNVHADEMATIRKYVLPQIVERLDAAASGNDILIQFDHGGAGLTNGIAALKLRLDAMPSLVSQHEHGYASIPDLYGRRLRSSVLYDGLYALRNDARFVERHEGDFTRADQQRLASIVSFFIVPSMGIKPTQSEKQAARISDILVWLLDYQPQPFPGAVDRDKAAMGSQLYAKQCAICHGSYSSGIDKPRLVSYPNRLVPQDQIKSDPERWRAITDDMIRVIGRTPVAKKVNAANARGYVAPILNGIWTSAPYMHNGSVPTLWHLMHPESRPGAFPVGGHKLDLVRVGIAIEPDPQGPFRYPTGYQPWSTPVMFDTTGRGRSNNGHEDEFNRLSEAEKDALIEFMKVL
jgi:mono/diheme cytochrome c family protein